ncbi:hypothetical protein CDIK_3282 [Cucumispora dikerogammari]|nr:hypothetical protein CDIK_3282 [Cucumispora dikerogammari]
MVYDKEIFLDEFKSEFLNSFTKIEKPFFPLSDYPVYLNPKNFSESVPLNYITLKISYTQEDKKPVFFKYRNCSLGVNISKAGHKLGIEIVPKMKQHLLDCISNYSQIEIKVNIGGDRETEEFTIMKIYTKIEYIRVSTIPMLDHIKSRLTLKHSREHKNQLQKYSFLFHLYMIRQAEKNKRISKVEVKQNMNISITTFFVYCHTPIYFVKQRMFQNDILEKKICSLTESFKHTLIIYALSEYKGLKTQSPITLLKYCYNQNEILKKHHIVRFSENLSKTMMKTHTVSFDVRYNMPNYSYCLEKKKIDILNYLNDGYRIMISTDIDENIKDIKLKDLKKIKIEISITNSNYVDFSFKYYRKQKENGQSYIFVEIPKVTEDEQNIVYRELYSALRKQNGLFSMIIYYKEYNASLKIQKSNTYQICLDYGNLFWRHESSAQVVI